MEIVENCVVVTLIHSVIDTFLGELLQTKHKMAALLKLHSPRPWIHCTVSTFCMNLTECSSSPISSIASPFIPTWLPGCGSPRIRRSILHPKHWVPEISQKPVRMTKFCEVAGQLGIMGEHWLTRDPGLTPNLRPGYNETHHTTVALFINPSVRYPHSLLFRLLDVGASFLVWWYTWLFVFSGLVWLTTQPKVVH